MNQPALITPEGMLNSAKQSLNIPTIIAICGSTRFMAEMAEADLRETAAGRIVVKPGCNMKKPHPLWSDPDQAEALKVELDALHKAKIRLADEVLVVGDYIGDSTRSEIIYARRLNKPIRYTHPEVNLDCSDCGGTGADPDDLGDWNSSVGMYNPTTRMPCSACSGSSLAGVTPEELWS